MIPAPPDILQIFKNILEFASPVLTPIWEIVKVWWWAPLPFILWKPFLFLWLWWRIEIWLSKEFRPVLLEIKIPKEIVKPIRAMEDVIASLHGVIYHPPDWWEKWVDGQLQTSLSFEIVSDGEEIHFYLRIHSAYRDAVEASIYAQYPEAEITQVDDYIKYVPQDVPNRDWDFWGTDYVLFRPDPYPILTYKTFETEQEALEEKRIDPVSTLLEALSKIKPGEQFWLQINATPLNEPDTNPTYGAFLKEGLTIRDELAKRVSPPPKFKPMAQEAADLLFSGKIPEGPEVKKEEIIPPEMKLTPGERAIVTAIEEKIAKPCFSVFARFIYLGERDVFFKPNFRLGFAFFNNYVTANLNGLYPLGKTLTKIHKHWFLPINLLRSRRAYMRQRKLFRNYINRFSPFFPRAGGTFILNTEEVASLYHFPSWVVSPVPGVPRVEAKKGPPPALPTE